MLKSLSCDFLTGPLTDEGSLEVLKHSLEQQSAGCHEVLYYKKNGTGIWMEVSTIQQHNVLCPLYIQLLHLIICSFFAPGNSPQSSSIIPGDYFCDFFVNKARPYEPVSGYIVEYVLSFYPSAVLRTSLGYCLLVLLVNFDIKASFYFSIFRLLNFSLYSALSSLKRQKQV